MKATEQYRPVVLCAFLVLYRPVVLCAFLVLYTVACSSHNVYCLYLPAECTEWFNVVCSEMLQGDSIEIEGIFKIS